MMGNINPLNLFFDDIHKNKKQITNSNDGKGFEECLRRCLRGVGFDFVGAKEDKVIVDYLKKIKPKVLDTLATAVLDNELAELGPKYTNIYIHQPYGSQQFPDFLVFTKHKIFCLESKYSTSNGNKPIWNSNLPKSNTIYIFGCYEKKDITFFVGEDILPQNERVILNKFFSETTTKLMDDFQNELKEKFKNSEMSFEHGFNVYIRKAFEQSQVINPNANINYFDKGREKNEENVKKFIDLYDIMN
ncbi:MAG: type II restriction endonuclease [Clostridia bacterium]